MSVMASKLFYVIIFALATITMYLSVKKTKHLNIWTIISALILSAVIGLRGVSVGIDTLAYTEFFEALEQQIVFGVRGIDEPGFIFVSYVVVQLFGSVQFAFFFWALVTNLLIVLRLHELKERIAIPIAMLTYLAAFFFLEFNVLRQVVAVSIIFYATRWIEKRQYIKFLIACLIAVSIHSSAIIAIALIPISMLYNWRRYRPKQQALIFLILLIAVGGFVLVAMRYMSLYGHYLDSDLSADGVGMLIPIKIVSFLICMVYVRTVHRKVVTQNCDILEQENRNWKYYLKTAVICYFIGLIIYFISYYVKYADRAAYYFFMFEIICYGYWYRLAKRNDIIKLLICLLVLLPLILDFVSSTGGQGQFPYMFYWS